MNTIVNKRSTHRFAKSESAPTGSVAFATGTALATSHSSDGTDLCSYKNEINTVLTRHRDVIVNYCNGDEVIKFFSAFLKTINKYSGIMRNADFTRSIENITILPDDDDGLVVQWTYNKSRVIWVFERDFTESYICVIADNDMNKHYFSETFPLDKGMHVSILDKIFKFIIGFC